MKKAISLFVVLATLLSLFAAFPAAAAEPSVVGFEITKAPDKTEYSSALDLVTYEYYDWETDSYISESYYTIEYMGIEVTLTFSDSSQKKYSYSNNSSDEELTFFSEAVKMPHVDIEEAPWSAGKNQVTLVYESFSDSFEIELFETTVVCGEMLTPPEITSSLLCGMGYETDGNFYYTYDLRGLSYLLEDNLGNTKTEEVFYYSEDIITADSQLEQPWGPGVHAVDVYYRDLKIGSFDFTVEDFSIESYELIQEPQYSCYIADINLFDIDLSATFRVYFSNGEYEDITLEEVANGVGYGQYFGSEIIYGWDYSVVIYREFDLDGNFDEGAIYLTVYQLEGYCTDIEITSLPACIDYIDGLMIDYTTLDFTGLAANLTLSDGTVIPWEYNPDTDGASAVVDGVPLYIHVLDNFIYIDYRGDTKEISPTKTSYVYDHVYGEITENGTIQMESLPIDHLNIYKFTPWDSGEYSFDLEGAEQTAVMLFYEDDGVLSTVYEGIAAIDSVENFTADFTKGETYYIAFVSLPASEDGMTLSVTVYHEASYVKGDVNGDGDVNMRDVLAARAYISGDIAESEINVDALTVFDGESISMRDVLKIRQFVAGNIPEL